MVGIRLRSYPFPLFVYLRYNGVGHIFFVSMVPVSYIYSFDL